MTYRHTAAAQPGGSTLVSVDPISVRAWSFALGGLALFLALCVAPTFHAVSIACAGGGDPAARCEVRVWHGVGAARVRSLPASELFIGRAAVGDLYEWHHDPQQPEVLESVSEQCDQATAREGGAFTVEIGMPDGVLCAPSVQSREAARRFQDEVAAARAGRSGPAWLLGRRFKRFAVAGSALWLVALVGALARVRARRVKIALDAARATLRIQSGWRAAPREILLHGLARAEVEHDGAQHVLYARAGDQAHELARGARRGLEHAAERLNAVLAPALGA